MTEYLLTPAQQHVLLALWQGKDRGVSPVVAHAWLESMRVPMSQSNVYSVLARLRVFGYATDTWHKQGNRRRVFWSATDTGAKALFQSMQGSENQATIRLLRSTTEEP